MKNQNDIVVILYKRCNDIVERGVGPRSSNDNNL
jgi:hypothetical protein